MIQLDDTLRARAKDMAKVFSFDQRAVENAFTTALMGDYGALHRFGVAIFAADHAGATEEERPAIVRDLILRQTARVDGLADGIWP